MPVKSVQYLPNGIRAGTMMIRDGLHLPNVPGMETDAYSRQWRSVQALDSFNLGRKLDAIGWHLFFVAGRITTIAFGLAGEKSVNRAVQRIVAKVRALDLNCLELTTISRKRFLGLPYIEIFAHSFHIQQGWLLQSLEERRRSAAQIEG